MSRVALSKLVTRIVDKWSLDFLQRAKLGDTEAMVQVAEIMFSKNGWGQISYNPSQARRWLETASTRGDPFAQYALRNLNKLVEQRHEEMRQVTRYGVNSLEKPKLGFDAEQQIARATNNTHRLTELKNDPYLKRTMALQERMKAQNIVSGKSPGSSPSKNDV